MKNVTVAIDEDLYRRARVRAAQEGTSLSRVVKDVITRFAAEETPAERADAEREQFYAQADAKFAGLTGTAIHTGWREELYDTARGRQTDRPSRA